MSDLDMKIFAAQIGKDMPQIDLHGLYPDDAIRKLDIFLYNDLLLKEERFARVIYGGGKGKLRSVVITFLSSHPLIKNIIEENGSCIVMI